MKFISLSVAITIILISTLISVNADPLWLCPETGQWAGSYTDGYNLEPDTAQIQYEVGPSITAGTMDCIMVKLLVSRSPSQISQIICAIWGTAAGAGNYLNIAAAAALATPGTSPVSLSIFQFYVETNGAAFDFNPPLSTNSPTTTFLLKYPPNSIKETNYLLYIFLTDTNNLLTGMAWPLKRQPLQPRCEAITIEGTNALLTYSHSIPGVTYSLIGLDLTTGSQTNIATVGNGDWGSNTIPASIQPGTQHQAFSIRASQIPH